MLIGRLLLISLLTVPSRAQEPPPAASPIYSGSVTHYGTSFNDRTLGCGASYGLYHETRPDILATSPNIPFPAPCGAQVHVVGPAGSLTVTRMDTCGGCASTTLDLSEAGNMAVCGIPPGESFPRPHTCRVTFYRVGEAPLPEP